MADRELRAELFAFYEAYTQTFQSAYERFAAGGVDAEPDARDALPFYHAPCLFITPLGVALYATEADLAHHFEGIMRDMRSKRYQRTGLGEVYLTPLGSRCVLLSLAIARFDLDDAQYDEYGVTYTVVRTDGRWQVAVVNTHPKGDVLKEDRGRS